MRIQVIVPAIVATAVAVLPQLTAPASAQVRSDCNVKVVGRVRGGQVQEFFIARIPMYWSDSM